MTINKTNPQVSIAKEFAEGTTFVVTPQVEVAGEQVVVRCTEGALKGMLWHALRGLPKSEEGGSVDGTEAVEVKGFLLGRVDLTSEQRVVTIKEIVQLPFNEQDAGDAAYFNAQDRAILEGKLRSRPSLQLVGNYHSHPNHDIKLSDQDVIYLSQYLPESYHVAAIVGPREPAVGFFLKSTEGEYTPWQEPVARTEYVKVDLKKKENGDPAAKPGFAWRPAIEVQVDESGRVVHVSGKKVNKKRVALYIAAAVVAIAVIVYLLIPPVTPVMKVTPTRLEFNSSSNQSQILLLELDKKGEFQFIIQDKDLPPWLEIDQLNGELTFEQKRELMIMVDVGQIPYSEKRSHVFNIVGSPVKGGTGNTINVEIVAVNDKEIVPIEDSWDLPPLRVVGRRFLVTLPADEPVGGDIEITVRGYSRENGAWKYRWTHKPSNRSFTREADAFGSPLDWDRIKIEATAISKIDNPDRILQYKYEGSSTLQKRTQDWKLEEPTLSKGKLTLTTKPVGFPGEALFTSRAGNKDEATRVQQNAGKPVSFVFDSSDDQVGVSLAYVGDDGVYELKYSYRPDKSTKEDNAFDNSQGPQGGSFRTAYPREYADANLALLGKYGGPKHLMDIPEEQRWGRLRICANRKVQESWKDIVAAVKKAPLGQLAWEYNHQDRNDPSTPVMLYFVFPEDNYGDALNWALKQDEIYKWVKDEIERQGGRIHFYWGPNYGTKKVYPVSR